MKHGRRWLLAFLAWTAVALSHALAQRMSAIVHCLYYPWREALANNLFTYWPWMFLTPFVGRMARRFPFERGRRARALAVHAALGLGLTLALYTAFLPLGILFLGEPLPTRFGSAFREFLPYRLHLGLFTYAAVVVLAVLAEQRRQREAEALRVAELEGQLAQAQLQALKAQLHPHFLFNTLHTIASLVDEEPAAARRMTARLGDFLRLTLHGDEASHLSLARELDYVRHYLAIEQLRFRDRLKVEEHVEGAALRGRVPNLILQPLVENALRHGLAPRGRGGTLAIRASREGGRLRIRVEDDGVGLPASPVHGIGLSNVSGRLERLYGADHRVELRPRPGGGTCVELDLPYEEAA